MMKSGEAGHDDRTGREWAFRKHPNLTDGDWPFTTYRDPGYWCLSRLAVPSVTSPGLGIFVLGNRQQRQSLSPEQGSMVQCGLRGQAGPALSNQTSRVTV